jgi:outer membrane protein assembly factor BamB
VDITCPSHWPQWRGPFFNGVAKGAAPVEFSDAKNIKWKVAISGRGFSTPVIWGDRIFLTTALPTGKVTKAAPPSLNSPVDSNFREVGAGEEHKFIVMCLDKNTGKTLWERVAKVATPHEGYHAGYGSFASNSPATDGSHLYASLPPAASAAAG